LTIGLQKTGDSIREKNVKDNLFPQGVSICNWVDSTDKHAALGATFGHRLSNLDGTQNDCYNFNKYTTTHRSAAKSTIKLCQLLALNCTVYISQ